MIIDLHAHYIPRSLATLLRARSSAPCIRRLGDGSEELVMPIGSLAFRSSYTRIDERLAMMSSLGVQRQVLSLPGLFGIDSLPLDESAPLVRAFNDDLSQICRDQPTRFAGLAALPLADMDAALSELRRTRALPGFVGAIVPSNAFVDLVQASRWAPLFEEGNRLGCHFFVHPGRRPDQVPDSSPMATEPKLGVLDSLPERRALAVQANLGEAMVTLQFTEFLDGFPDVTIHVANLGGTLPAVIERMDHTVLARNPGAPLPSTRMRRIHVDCASLGPRALELAVAIYSHESIVLGTDCPIFLTDWTLGAVRDAKIEQLQRDAILGENAARLLDRFGLS
ncbi:MAG: amidohydrolase [Burkholderiaceae bacterium]|nr:amidohydrolase [Burkholderiaceae bacterium]